MSGEYVINRTIVLIFTIYFSIWDIRYRHLYVRDILIFYVWIALSYLGLYYYRREIAYTELQMLVWISILIYAIHYVVEDILHISLIGRGDILYIIGLLWIFPSEDLISILMLTVLGIFPVSAGVICYAFYKGRNIRKHKLALLPFLCLSLCIIYASGMVSHV